MLVRCAPYRPRHRLVPLDYQASAVRRTAGKCLPLPPLAKMCICVISDLTAHGDMGGRSIVDTGGSSAVAGYWTVDSSRRSPPRWYCTVRNHLARWPLVALQINCRRPAAIGPPPPPPSPPFTAFLPPALPSARTLPPSPRSSCRGPVVVNRQCRAGGSSKKYPSGTLVPTKVPYFMYLTVPHRTSCCTAAVDPTHTLARGHPDYRNPVI